MVKTTIDADVKVKGNTPSGQIPFTISLSEDLERAIAGFLNNLENNCNFAVNIIKCRGANSKLEKVAAIVTINGNQSFVRCPRIINELEYVCEGKGKAKYDLPMCYCGKEKYIPFVEKEDFDSSEIFTCPYARKNSP